MSADLGWPGPPGISVAEGSAARPVVLLLGPHLGALSGVSSHLRTLLSSSLSERYLLAHFQVGSEGRNERRLGRLARLLIGPWALAKAILMRRAAIVHINTSLNRRAFWRDLAYLMVARACGARVLLQVHGGALPQDFFRGRVLAAMSRVTLQLASAVVVLAQSELDAYRVFVPKQRVVLIPNAVACPAEQAARRFATSRSLRLVYIGRLAKDKGLFELLQGLHIANAQGARHSLTIAGRGPDEGRLRRRARELCLAQQVVFVGAVGDEGRDRLLGNADIFVLASHSEGLPYALLEAMAAGVPVITTPVGAIPDVVHHAVHGLLVAPGDAQGLAQALARLAADREQLARMGTACRLRIAGTYSIEKLADAFGRLYAELLAPPPGRIAPDH